MRDFGVYSYSDLLAVGYMPRDIERLIRADGLQRVTRGWFASPSADRDVALAIRAGARLGCVSGCDKLGLWTPEDHKVHLVYGNARKPRNVPGTVVHHYEGRQAGVAVWPLEESLTQVIRHHDVETALIVLESAVALGMVSLDEALNLEGPVKTVRTVRKYLNLSESGSETRVRYFLERHNIPVTPQVVLPGLGRVDLVVKGNLIVECDSRGFHSSADQMEEDRRRDLVAFDLGYDRLRLSYSQIWYDWQNTQRVMLRRIAGSNSYVVRRR